MGQPLKKAATDKSVRDNPQRAVIENGAVTIINKNGRRTVTKRQFPLLKWEELDKKGGNVNWHRREFVKSLDTVVVGDSPEEHCLKERIIDAQIMAIKATQRKAAM